MQRVLNDKIPTKLKSNVELDILLNSLLEEIKEDYNFSSRKAIGK